MSYVIKKIKTFKKAVAAAGTAEALSATPKLVKKLVIVASKDNTADIYLGDSSVSSANGFILTAGDKLDTDNILAIDGYLDLSQIYIDAGVSGEFIVGVYAE